MRIGKAISKGAAAGGQWGAALGAAIEGRKYIGKALAAAGVLLFLPVLFILMLPSLIFGGLTSSKAPDAAEPVLNDGAAVTENMTNIAYAVNQVLGEGIDDVTTRIGEHFATTAGYDYEIVNPYEGNLVSNANIFLAEYCAAKDVDWQAVSLADMEDILRQGKGNLYTFTCASEVRVVEADDPKTTDVVEQESQLACDVVLVDDQSRVADQQPVRAVRDRHALIARNPEVRAFRDLLAREDSLREHTHGIFRPASS